MSEFRTLLEDLADQAKLYDVTDRAMAVARRRRRLQRAVPATVAACVVLIAAATALLPRHHTRPPAPASPTVAWLPARIPPPDRAQPLPSGPVGAGALLYFENASSRFHSMPLLITTTGQVYRLPEQDFTSFSLSPDGRWLMYVDGGKPYLRDLTGTTRRPLPAMPASVAWSADGHWLAVEATHAPGSLPSPHPVTRVDLRTGAMKSYVLTCCYDSYPVYGVRDDGQLVFITEIGGSTRTASFMEYDVYTVDPAIDRATPKSIRLPMHLGVSASDPNAKYEVLVDWKLAPGAARLVFANAGNLSLVDLTSMRIVRVYRVPMSQAVLPRTEADHDDTWMLGAVVPEGVLLVHRWFAAGQIQTELELLDLHTGTHTPVSQLPSGNANGVTLR